jgi:PAS domain S-box-containing protein
VKALQPARVLVVDDNEQNRYAVVRVLQQAFFDVVGEAGSGTDALHMAKELLPDVVILDVSLRDASGFDVAAALRADPGTGMTAILHLSAEPTSSQVRARGLEEGADAYLTQPFQPHELVALVNALVRARRSAAHHGAQRAAEARAAAAEKALAETRRLIASLDFERNRLARLFQQAPFFLCTLRGPDHVFEMANDAYYAHTGLRDIIGKPVREALPEIGRQGYIELLDRVLATGVPYTAETKPIDFQRASGASVETRYSSFTYQPIVELDGAISGIVVHGVDVTNVVRASEALREREAQHLDLLESLPVIVYHADAFAPYGSSYINRAVEAFGFDREEWVQDRSMWMKCMHPDDRERIAAATEHALAHERTIEYEYRVVARDGTVHAIYDRGAVLRDETGRATSWRGVMLDITAHRRVEEALRASEERFRLAGRATNDVIWDWELGADKLTWGESMASVFGHVLLPEQGSSSWWQNLLHPEDRDRVLAGIQASIQGTDTAWADEYRFRRADGAYATVLDRGYIVRNESGVATRMIGSVANLTPRLETAERMRLQARLLEAVEQAVIATDAGGRINYWNRFAERLYGWNAAEVLGRNIMEVTVPSERAQQAGAIMVGMPQHESFTGEFDVRRKDGTTFTALVTTSPIEDAEGRYLGAVGVSQDMTERRHLEEQLRQSQKMEAVGRLAGGVAHDFNNLLTVIHTNAAFLLEDIDAADPRRQDVLQIRDASDRAAGLTRQLLAFSRKQILQPRLLDVNATVANLKPMLSRLIREDVAIETRLSVERGRVMADPGQFEQVLLNLAVNARDAMPEGGRLFIETANVELDEAYAAQERASVLPGSYIMVSVSDTGTGMSREVLSRVFEPFFTTKPPGEGTGLGLATVYGIVKQSGGHVWVYSEPGEGTTFKIYFPRIEGAPDAGGANVPTSGPRGSETVLLVEDEPAVRAIAKRILTRHGYRVLETCNGKEALAVATQHREPIHLVLTDVVMPELGGPALMERLRAVRPEVATLFMSGYTDDDIVRRGALELGRRFVQKPFNASGLLAAVREALDLRE